jgi:hypothetical protein
MRSTPSDNGRAGRQARTAAEILRLISRMAADELKRLIDALARLPNPLGDYVCVPKGILDFLVKWDKQSTEMRCRLIDIVGDTARKLADTERRLARRNRGPTPESVALRREARRLKAEPKTWAEVAEQLWREHPEWFDGDPRPHELEGKPHQKAELLTRLRERIRVMCRRHLRTN